MVANREPRSRRVAIRAALPGDAGSLYAWRQEESVRRHQPLQETSAGAPRCDVLRGQLFGTVTDECPKRVSQVGPEG